MAWNKPTNTDVKTTGKQAPKFRGLIAAVIGIVVCAVAGLFVLFSPDEAAKAEMSTRPKAIRDVGTNVAARVAEPEPDKNSIEWLKANDPRFQIPPGSYRKANGRLYTPEGRRILERPANRVIHLNKGKKVFQHQAENQIARLLSIEPGKMFIGNMHYGPQFVESFKRSIAEPTLVTADDDEETKALKRHINEVKADLRARMDNGEDICKIMKETEDDLRSLSTFKLNIQKDLNAAKLDENVSAEDYELYVEAANKMLEERGLKKITAPKIVESQLKYLREKNRARMEAKAKAQEMAKETP